PYDLIDDAFGPGRNGPLVVTVDITQTTEVLEDLDAIAEELARVPGVASVGTPIPNETVDTAIIQVIPTTGPADPETTALVEHIRELAPTIADRYGTPPRRDRLDRRRDRRLRPARRRPAAVRPRRGRALDRAAHDGVPLDRRADQGRPRLPAE